MRYPMKRLVVSETTLLSVQETLLDVLQEGVDTLEKGELEKSEAEALNERMANISRTLTVFEQPMNELDFMVKDGLKGAADEEGTGVFIEAEKGMARAARHFASLSIRFLVDVQMGVQDYDDYHDSPLKVFNFGEMAEEDEQFALSHQIGELRSVVESCDAILGLMPLDHLTEKSLSAFEPDVSGFESETFRRQMSCRHVIADYFAELETLFRTAAAEPDGLAELMEFFQVDQLPDDLYWYHGIDGGSIPEFYETLHEITESPALGELLDEGDVETFEISEEDAAAMNELMDRFSEGLDEDAVQMLEVARQTFPVAVHILNRAKALAESAELNCQSASAEEYRNHIRRLLGFATVKQWQDLSRTVDELAAGDGEPKNVREAMVMTTSMSSVVEVLNLVRPDFVADPDGMDALYELSDSFEEDLWRYTLNLEE